MKEFGEGYAFVVHYDKCDLQDEATWRKYQREIMFEFLTKCVWVEDGEGGL